MLQIQQLRFFDSKGHNCNFVYEDGVWKGRLFFEKISVGLITSEHLFILEEAKKSNGSINYIYPEGDAPITATWVGEEIETTQISLFDVTIEDELSYINKIESGSYELDPDSGNVVDGVRTSNEIDTASLQINISMSADEEGIWERTLQLKKDDGTLFAEIQFYGETEGEDIRFKNMLRTLYGSVGDIDLEDTFIFRDADVLDEKADYELINRKRKQLLLEAHNIFPYIGADKGLVNIIEYFGYDDVDVKELWVNIDEEDPNFDKKRMVQLPYQQIKKGTYEITEYIKPGNTWKKTNRFGLFYDINKETGEVDEFGVPETEDAFLFTNEEILIKLFGLKEYLKERFLPGNLRVYSITGEGIYFERHQTNIWTDQTEHYHIDLHRDVDFEISDSVGYIQDLREYIDELNDLSPSPSPIPSSYPQDISPSLAPSLRPEEIGTELLKWYGYLDPKNFSDFPGIPVGYPVDLSITSFDISWSEAQISFKEINELKMKLEDVGIGDVYEVEWIITKGSPKPWSTRIRGKASDLREATFILPFAGYYDVELKIWDLDNNYTSEFKQAAIEVRAHEADFAAIYRTKDRGFTWRDVERKKPLKFKDTKGRSFEYPYSNGTTFEDTTKVKWLSLNIFNYLNETEILYEGKELITHIDRSEEYIVLPGTGLEKLIKGSWVKIQNPQPVLPVIDRIPINSFDETNKAIQIGGTYDATIVKHGVFTKIYPLFRAVEDSVKYSFNLNTNSGILTITKDCTIEPTPTPSPSPSPAP